MSEKVLREIKIIETDEGFRIEMTGDKEELRRMIFEQSRPFFAWGQRFGGRGPFGHHHDQGEQHEHHGHDHGHGEHGSHEHMHPPFEGREQPTPEEMRNQHFFFRRFAGRGEQGHGEHGSHEHMRPPFEGRSPLEGREEPTLEEMHNQHFFFRRFAGHGEQGRGGWKAKRGGYDLGPWWDEGAPSDEQTM